jgi:putative two-component system response regulator
MTIQSLLLQSIIMEEGYICNLANNKQEALSLLNTNPYELILLDITLADINGMELLQMLKSDGEKKMIPVIALSAKGDRENIKAAMKNGASDYLAKPFNIQDLLNKISSIFKLTN